MSHQTHHLVHANIAIARAPLGDPTPRDAYIREYVADAPLYWNDPDYDAAWLWEGMAFDMESIYAFRDLYQRL